jgi:hypothetical protein
MIIIRKQLSWRDHHCFTAPLLIALDAKKYSVCDSNFARASIQGDDLVDFKMHPVAGTPLHFSAPVARSMQANFSPNARASASHHQFKQAFYAAVLLLLSILMLYSIFLDFQANSAVVSTPIKHIVAFTNSTVVKVEF